MLAITIMLTIGLLLSGVVAAYVAFPHRGEAMPVVPQLGEAMKKGVNALPTLEDDHSRV